MPHRKKSRGGKMLLNNLLFVEHPFLDVLLVLHKLDGSIESQDVESIVVGNGDRVGGRVVEGVGHEQRHVAVEVASRLGCGTRAVIVKIRKVTGGPSCGVVAVQNSRASVMRGTIKDISIGDVGIQCREEQGWIAIGFPVRNSFGHLAVVFLRIGLQININAPQICSAFNLPCRVDCAFGRDEHERCQHGDDGDRDKDLNKGESCPVPAC